jgi:hypothetical protein
MLLILNNEYKQHEDNIKDFLVVDKIIIIDSFEWLLCDLINPIPFDLYSVNMNQDNFKDDIVIPNKIINGNY